MPELLKGLPVRVENRIRPYLERLTLKWLFVSILKALIFFIFAVVFVGVIEGISYDIWLTSVIPWLKTARSDVTNGLLLTEGLFCIIGWSGALLSGLFAFLIYGADRRRLGQLEEVGEENASRERRIDELNETLGRLRSELQRTQEAGSQLLAMFGSLDRELLMLLTQGSVADRTVIGAFFESACRRLFDYLREDTDLFRASIFLPDEQNREFLVIKWDYGVGEASRRWNRWYIGDRDPETLGIHRGIPGEVFVKGNGCVVKNVRDNPDFYDSHQPPRSILPYNTILLAVIHPNDIKRKYGVFCLDSLTYNFSEKDLEIAQQVAIRLGWLIYWSQTSGIICEDIEKRG